MDGRYPDPARLPIIQDNPHRNSVLVDPAYPLPNPQNDPYQKKRRSYLEGDDLDYHDTLPRTESRRRKVSGQSSSGAPEVQAARPAKLTKAPPPTYRTPAVQTFEPPPAPAATRSFSARAQMTPHDYPAEPAPARTDNPNRRSRGTSIGQQTTIPVPAAQAHTSHRRSDSGSQRIASNPVTQQEHHGISAHERARTIPTNGTAVTPQMATARAALLEPQTRPRPEQKPKFAADRSPLQKLEVKLQDISKEEKRARVQEAEQKLKDAEALRASRIVAGEPEEGIRRSSSKRTPNVLTKENGAVPQRTSSTKARGQDIAVEMTADRANSRRAQEEQVGDLDALNPRRSSAPFTSSDPAQLNRQPGSRREVTDSQRRARSGDHTRDHHFGRDAALVGGAAAAAETAHHRSRSRHEAEQYENSPQSRAPKVDTSVPDTTGSGSNRQVPGPQAALYEHKAGRDNQAHKPADDPVPGHAVRSHTQALTYEIPPQTAAGIEARQQVGFGSEPNDPAENVPTEHKHRLSRILHHGHHAETLQHSDGPPRHLDEWRKGGVARLTLADIVATADTKKDTAWWERRQNGNRRADGTSVGNEQVGSLDGSLDDNTGMAISTFYNSQSSGDLPCNGVWSRSHSPQVKRYADHEESLLMPGKKQFWLRQHLSLNHIRPQLALYPMYSYSCPQLSLHDPSHDKHICEPYLSKTLIRSMRSIRVRTPAAPSSFNPPLYLKCGPLLRYTGMKRDKIESSSRRAGTATTERETWRGSVMIVTHDSQSVYEPAPTLRLFHQPMELLPPPPQQRTSEDDALPAEYIDPIGGMPKLTRTGGTVYVKPVEDLEPGTDVSRIENDDGLYEETRTANVPQAYGRANELLSQSPLPFAGRPKKHEKRDPKPVGRYQEVLGSRLHAERGVTFWRFSLEVELGEAQARIAYRINKGASVGFWVPARGQTMNIMFHSCNGFSLSVDPHVFSGPDPLWRDVLNQHQTKPFHVMIGGGDQIYNDAIMKQTKLFQEWLTIKNPHHKHQTPFSPAMQEEMETFYLERYSMWFSQGLFGMANSQIPMVNIWDDHDIIDGFGSYPDHFMSTPVFCGLGNIAFKYYMLFQHQSVPDETSADEPCWLLGSSRGPYINEYSRSIFLSMGKNVAFLGLDCRTERMRDEILSEASYDLIFDRCKREIISGETKHLIVLLGVPIAYPRLVWLENVLTSRIMDPIKALGRAGMLGGFVNKFDGGVEILDDLDDHWTAKNHKDERNWFVQALQDLAAEKSVRITILGGDVHLAAVGQFYSNPKLKIPKDRDFRYMPNVISSAIVNTPPPDMMADVLNKRNKIHHLDADTDEDMIPMFTHDVNSSTRNNKRLLPRRNWCSITEYRPGNTPPPTPPSSIGSSEFPIPPSQQSRAPGGARRTMSLTRNDPKPGGLLRRLSGQARHSPEYESPYAEDNQVPQGRSSSDGYFPPVSAANNQSNSTNRTVSAPLPIRPVHAFHRRPTNLSEKAAAKGGAEEDMGVGSINLEHGLDIKLNCEVDQRDPAGVTVPYRLLVPALWYTDEREPEKEGGLTGLLHERKRNHERNQDRKPSLFRRITQSRRRDSYSDEYGSGSEISHEDTHAKHPVAVTAAAATGGALIGAGAAKAANRHEPEIRTDASPRLDAPNAGTNGRPVQPMQQGVSQRNHSYDDNIRDSGRERERKPSLFRRLTQSRKRHSYSSDDYGSGSELENNERHHPGAQAVAGATVAGTVAGAETAQHASQKRDHSVDSRDSYRKPSLFQRLSQRRRRRFDNDYGSGSEFGEDELHHQQPPNGSAKTGGPISGGIAGATNQRTEPQGNYNSQRAHSFDDLGREKKPSLFRRLTQSRRRDRYDDEYGSGSEVDDIESHPVRPVAGGATDTAGTAAAGAQTAQAGQRGRANSFDDIGRERKPSLFRRLTQSRRRDRYDDEYGSGSELSDVEDHHRGFRKDAAVGAAGAAAGTVAAGHVAQQPPRQRAYSFNDEPERKPSLFRRLTQSRRRDRYEDDYGSGSDLDDVDAQQMAPHQAAHNAANARAQNQHDRQHQEALEQHHEKKPSLLRRLSLNRRDKGPGAPRRQGQGNWGKDSQSASDVGSLSYSDEFTDDEDDGGRYGKGRFDLGSISRRLSLRRRDRSPYDDEPQNGILPGKRVPIAHDRTSGPRKHETRRPPQAQVDRHVHGTAQPMDRNIPLRGASLNASHRSQVAGSGLPPNRSASLGKTQGTAVASGPPHSPQQNLHPNAVAGSTQRLRQTFPSPPQTSATAMSTHNTSTPIQQQQPQRQDQYSTPQDQRKANSAQKIKRSGAFDSPAYTEDLDGEDIDDGLLEEGRPQKRFSKFDASGNSKFFGTNTTIQGGTPPQQSPGARRGSQGVAGSQAIHGYGGVEAYKEPGKGWRRFF
ncbi:hypothetical protein MMC25_004770 [Agyrium rufum]|nr:hypothetical protein [Agyrium rufum]